MAFDFPVRDPSRLFFPTVHVHDGHVWEKASFDHILYFQADVTGYEAADKPVGSVVDVARARGVVDVDTPLHKQRLFGVLKNEDTYVPLSRG